MLLRTITAACFGLLAMTAAGGEISMRAQPALPTVAGPVQRDGNFASFSHRDHPGNRIGYRFHEHAPLVFGAAPEEDAGSGFAEVEALEQAFAARPGVLIHTRPVDEEGWCPQDWTYYVAPAEDGFDLLWVIDVKDEGLNEYYCVQQCFRMTGETNGSDWRKEIALTPAFSEYDLWERQEANDVPLTSLSHVHAKGHWLEIPATRDNVGYRTPLGVQLDTKRTGGDIKQAGLEPYKPKMSVEVLDCGLIVRRDIKKEWVCGIFWDRTTHVTNHHPADCLHAVVNLGPIAPHGRRAIRGKVYWMNAPLEEVSAHWQRDFGGK